MKSTAYKNKNPSTNNSAYCIMCMDSCSIVDLDPLPLKNINGNKVTPITLNFHEKSLGTILFLTIIGFIPTLYTIFVHL